MPSSIFGRLGLDALANLKDRFQLAIAPEGKLGGELTHFLDEGPSVRRLQDLRGLTHLRPGTLDLDAIDRVVLQTPETRMNGQIALSHSEASALNWVKNLPTPKRAAIADDLQRRLNAGSDALASDGFREALWDKFRGAHPGVPDSAYNDIWVVAAHLEDQAVRAQAATRMGGREAVEGLERRATRTGRQLVVKGDAPNLTKLLQILGDDNAPVNAAGLTSTYATPTYQRNPGRVNPTAFSRVMENLAFGEHPQTFANRLNAFLDQVR